MELVGTRSDSSCPIVHPFPSKLRECGNVLNLEFSTISLFETGANPFVCISLTVEEFCNPSPVHTDDGLITSSFF
jgi:hypothetical protein